jgi:hypothetical protein
MYRYFLGALIGAIVMFLLFATWVSHAQEVEEPKAQLYQKPVLCAPTPQDALEMLVQVKKDGMKPLLYFYGNSFNSDASSFKSDFFILFDPEDDQITIVEKQPMNGFTCILSGGTGNVEFDPDVIKAIIGWEDIK